ncbi:hypothetical protein [Sulfurimonas sp.]|uniref:hypothetical protein n=1 Tax=Sulfurimonas sp. TaxID=2022749 RepID=UPI003D0EAEB3
MKKFLSVVGLVGLVASQAQAALTEPTLDTGNYETIAGAVLVGLAVMWGIKKAIGLIRA